MKLPQQATGYSAKENKKGAASQLPLKPDGRRWRWTIPLLFPTLRLLRAIGYSLFAIRSSNIIQQSQCRLTRPVLPPQGVSAFDTCVIGRFAVPFMSPAITMPAFWFLSIWNAWPPSTKNSDNTSAAPIESRAEFLYMMHLLLVGRVDPCVPMLISNQRASRFCSRLSQSYPLIC